MLTLAELLTSEPLARAEPQLLAGDVDAAAPVEWVHTSEIAEIGPLLQGGEMLLTTGLGLRGLDAEGLRRYAHELADYGAVALCLELGRTFRRVPDALVEAASARGLVVVALHRVVPFVDVTRAVHARIVDESAASLRRRQRYAARFEAVLLAGRGPAAIVRELASLAGTVAAFVTPDGRPITSAPDSATVTEGPARIVTVQGEPVGRVQLAQGHPTDADELLERAATALGMALARSPQGSSNVRDAARAALADVVHGLTSGPGETAARLSLLGVPPASVRGFVGVAVVLAAPGQLVTTEAAVAELVRGTMPWGVIGTVDEVVCGVVGVPDATPDHVRTRLAGVAAGLAQRVGAAEEGLLRSVTAGTAVDDLDAASATIAEAIETAHLAAHLPFGERVVLAEDAALVRLLVRFAQDPALADFVDARIGALLDLDAARASDDLATLEAYVDSRGSKTATAARLGVRRQTVYQRVERLERLLGGSLDDPHRWLAVSLALLARRVRTAGPVRVGRWSPR